jgi:hypothetical protein
MMEIMGSNGLDCIGLDSNRTNVILLFKTNLFDMNTLKASKVVRLLHRLASASLVAITTY